MGLKVAQGGATALELDKDGKLQVAGKLQVDTAVGIGTSDPQAPLQIGGNGGQFSHIGTYDKTLAQAKEQCAAQGKRLATFVSDYLKDKSPETRGTYRRSLNEFERYHAVRAQRPSSRFRFVEADVEAYKTYLMEERELSQVSVSTYLTALRRLCDYLVARGDLDENPARGVKGNRRPQSHTRGVLTADDVSTLFDAVPRMTPIGRRDRAMVALMVYAGLSEVELVRADLGDVDRTLMGTFLRVQGKGRQTKDKRDYIKDRDWQRDKARILRERG